MPPNCTDKAPGHQSGEVLLPAMKKEPVQIEQETSFRTSLPQVLATMAQSMLLFSLGMLVSVPTIVVPAVSGSNACPATSSLSNLSNLTSSADGCLRLSPSEASTFAGLLLILQPVGSLLAGVVQELVGRKLCMLLVNLPQLFGWLLLYYATSKWHLFCAAVCLGFTIGFMEAPTLSYVGEIAQPHLRGILASFTSLYISFGTLLMFLLGTFLHWKTAMAISTCVPVLTIVAILQIPESPAWLLLKGRDKDAQKALCWLRGWTTPENVALELKAMQEHVAASRLQGAGVPEKCIEAGTPCKPTLKEKLKDLMRPAMMQPLILVVAFFAFTHCAALNGARPYLVHVYVRLGVTVNPFLGTVISAVSQIGGVVTCMALVHRLGKRTLSLATMFLCSLICLCLGVYSLLFETGRLHVGWLPFVLMGMLSFSTYAGCGIVPWTLLAEVFPPRGRGVGGGVSAACFYVIWFVVTKTWPYLQSVIELYGMFFFYSTLGFIGCCYLYLCLPETEGKSLQQIEDIFKKNKFRR